MYTFCYKLKPVSDDIVSNYCVTPSVSSLSLIECNLTNAESKYMELVLHFCVYLFIVEEATSTALV